MSKKTALFIILILSAAGAAIAGEKLFTAVNEYRTGEEIYAEISEIAHSQSVSPATVISEITETCLDDTGCLNNKSPTNIPPTIKETKLPL